MKTQTENLNDISEKLSLHLNKGKGLNHDAMVDNRVKLHAAHAGEAQVHHEKAEEHDKKISGIIDAMKPLDHNTATKFEKKKRAIQMAHLQHHIEKRNHHLTQKHTHIFKAKQHFSWLQKHLA
jgi:hypothetical protein